MDRKNEITEIALSFMESAEMIEYMRNTDYLQVADVINIVMTSRSSLEDKISGVRLISEKFMSIGSAAVGWEIESIQKGIEECSSIITMGEFAMKEITENVPAGTVFNLKCYKNENQSQILRSINGRYSSFRYHDMPFITFEAAIHYLIEYTNETHKFSYISYEDATADISYTIEKWVPLYDGKMQLVLEWQLNHEGIVWFAHINDHLDYIDKDSLEIFDYHSVGQDLSIHIPYQVGDILTVDRRPKNGITHVVIAEIGNENDSCGIQVVHFNDGELKVSTLSYCLEAQAFCPRYYVSSGLHRLAKFTGKFSYPKALLNKISEAFKANPSLGKYGNVENYLEDFNSKLLNFLPADISIGDIIRIYSLCSYSKYYHGFYAVISDICHDTDCVEIICIEKQKLLMTNLRSAVGTISKFILEKYSADTMKTFHVPYLLKQISEEIRQNPTISKDESFIKRLSTLNNLPYIPEAHKKYNLLPGCVKYGGDIHYYPKSEYSTISKLLPKGETILPYHYGCAEYSALLDFHISKYGMTDGELNELGRMISDYKLRIKEMNIKENWSILRYIGESYGNSGAFGGFTHGRYYYLAGINEAQKALYIFDNEELGVVTCTPDVTRWEVVEDPTGMAAKVFYGDIDIKSDSDS